MGTKEEKRDRSLFLFLRALSAFVVQLLKSLLLADGEKRDRSLFLFLRALRAKAHGFANAVQLLKSLLLADGEKRDRFPTFH